MKSFSLLLLIFLSINSFGATYDIRLVISNGIIQPVSGVNLDVKTYESGVFSGSSDLFIWEVGDQVNLKVVNFDNEVHGFYSEGLFDIASIPVGDSATQNITISNPGIYRYFDPIDTERNAYMGLSGMIHVKFIGDPTNYFYWDIHDFEASKNLLISGGGNPSFSDYDPELFTINGNSNPEINNDAVARVTGNVGETFKIIMINNGKAIHSMHFHGYHLIIENDSYKPANVGREKDTFPLYPGEFLSLSCTPDKPGEYPVHDHNLVAVTGNDVYANGMFTTMLISQ